MEGKVFLVSWVVFTILWFLLVTSLIPETDFGPFAYYVGFLISSLILGFIFAGVIVLAIRGIKRQPQRST